VLVDIHFPPPQQRLVKIAHAIPRIVDSVQILKYGTRYFSRTVMRFIEHSRHVVANKGLVAELAAREQDSAVVRSKQHAPHPTGHIVCHLAAALEGAIELA